MNKSNYFSTKVPRGVIMILIFSLTAIINFETINLIINEYKGYTFLDIIFMFMNIILSTFLLAYILNIAFNAKNGVFNIYGLLPKNLTLFKLSNLKLVYLYSIFINVLAVGIKTICEVLVEFIPIFYWKMELIYILEYIIVIYKIFTISYIIFWILKLEEEKKAVTNILIKEKFASINKINKSKLTTFWIIVAIITISIILSALMGYSIELIEGNTDSYQLMYKYNSIYYITKYIYRLDPLKNIIVIVCAYNIVTKKNRDFIYIRNSNRISLIACGFIYIGIIFYFGFVYRSVDIESKGEAFILHDDIKLKSQMNAFKEIAEKDEELNIYTLASEEYILDLIRNKEYIKYIDSMGNINRLNEDGIGESISKYLESIYYNVEIRGFTVSARPFKELETVEMLKYQLKSGRMDFPINDILIEIDLYQDDENHSIQNYGINRPITFARKYNNNYNKEQKVLTNISGNKELQKNKIDTSIQFTIDEQYYNSEFLNKLIEGELIYNNQLSEFSNLVSKSKELIINSNIIDLLEKCSEQGYDYQLLDYIYFSAVTITTTGYGDITPSLPVARMYVTIEVILGIVVSGIFVSLLLSNKDNDGIETLQKTKKRRLKRKMIK